MYQTYCGLTPDGKWITTVACTQLPLAVGAVSGVETSGDWGCHSTRDHFQWIICSMAYKCHCVCMNRFQGGCGAALCSLLSVEQSLFTLPMEDRGIHAFTQSHLNMQTHAYARTHECTHTHSVIHTTHTVSYTCACTQVHTCAHTHARTHKRILMHKCMDSAHRHVHAGIPLILPLHYLCNCS